MSFEHDFSIDRIIQDTIAKLYPELEDLLYALIVCAIVDVMNRQ